MEPKTINVYVAASFAYESKLKTSCRKYDIEKVVDRIKSAIQKRDCLALDYTNFYLPHQLKIPNAWDISLEDWSNAVYQHDMEALDKADIVIFLSFGKENNAGSVWEVGYTYGRNDLFYRMGELDKIKKLVVIKMTRQSESLMISQSCDTIIYEKDIEYYDWIGLPKFRTKLEKIM